MIKKQTTLILLSFIVILDWNLTITKPAYAQQLKVSQNHHYLVGKDGAPFFWLGDTAWELFQRLNHKEATQYLENRAAKGFTVIQAVVLAELDGLNTPNAYGDTPFINDDPTKPNETYFKNVDFIVNKAQELGLYIGMLPTWGDKWNKKWGVGPVVFTPQNAEIYGRFLGRRYRDKPIIWILGGDRNPDTSYQLKIINALAKGLKEGDHSAHLMTYHPQGGSNSAEWFQNSDWLDFNMIQSGHAELNTPNYKTIQANYFRTPTKPTIDGESNYEDHPINWNPENGWFTDADVRQAAYWSMLAGALGYTYGNNNIWQMWEPGFKVVNYARTPWYQAMNQPGAFQMTYLRKLFESRPFYKLVPDENLISGDILHDTDQARAARANDSSFVLVYLTQGQNITVDLSIFNHKKVNAYWYNPRLGNYIRLDSFTAEDSGKFDPPSDIRKGNDWVLVLDAADAHYPPPGQISLQKGGFFRSGS